MTLVSSERTILFADVSGSTRLYERLGDKVAAKAIDALLDELSKIASEREGKEVKRIGDELMVVFSKPGFAFQAATEMQQRVSAWPPASGVPFAIRIGFHFGQVLEDKGDLEGGKVDFWGDAVNTAARLVELAKAGQILTSETTVDTLPQAQRTGLRDLDAFSVKGKEKAVHVFELLWGDTDDATQLAKRKLSSSAKLETKLRLEIGGRSQEFPADKTVLVLGRDATCDLVVGEKTTTSRLHARIERSGLQYVLVDESTNGTFLAIEGDREVVLRHDRMPLRGRGKIGFGASTSSATELLSFECS